MERNCTIDKAKFICLALMVFGHIPATQGCFYQVVNSFHMPFFFFASGLFFNSDRFGSRKGFQTLLFPYFVFNLFVVVINTIVSSLSASPFCVDNMVRSFFAILICSSDNSCPYYPMPIGPSWFLFSLFTVKICAKYLLRLKSQWVWGVVLLLFCLICVLEKYYSWFVFSIDSSIIGLLFFIIGYYSKQPLLGFLGSKKSLYLIPLLLLGTSFSWTNGWVSMCAGRMGDSVLCFIMFAIIGIMTVLSIAKYFQIPDKIISTFNYGAVFLICMNFWLLEYIMLLYKKFILFDLSAIMCWYEKVGILIVVFVISYPCIRILSRFCPWVLGRVSTKDK